MTIWSAPDVHYLLDDHLKRARIELLSDYRLKVKAEDDGGGEDPGFVAELIVDKLEAAARAGFDAVEASLKASASEYLDGKGLGAAAIRETLANACVRIVPPRRPRLEKVELGVIPNGLTAGILASAGLIAVFGLYVTGLFGMAAYLAGSLLSIGAGYALHRYLSNAAARHRAQLIDEWPARVCRHYSRALQEGAAYYEHVVRTAARGGTLIPWR